MRAILVNMTGPPSHGFLKIRLERSSFPVAIAVRGNVTYRDFLTFPAPTTRQPSLTC